MKISFDTEEDHREQEEMKTGIVFDLKILLSTIKGKTILMRNKYQSDQHSQADFDDIVNLVEESIIRTELISVPFTNLKNLPWEPIRLCD